MISDLQNEDKALLQLYCASCDNIECKSDLGYVYADSQKGCNKLVDEESFVRYNNYILEELPFWKMLSWEYVQERSKEMEPFLNKIYAAPTVAFRDHKGYKIKE